MVIRHLIGINGATLVVYSVDGYFQYEIAFWNGLIGEATRDLQQGGKSP
ncbi:MAG: hypothetical protein QNJ53_19165 [Pleurocapsa sp. MO_192.B19]|nr:hypothetical protein [Pleurocapsa sp. MO_192.B19]